MTTRRFIMSLTRWCFRRQVVTGAALMVVTMATMVVTGNWFIDTMRTRDAIMRQVALRKEVINVLPYPTDNEALMVLLLGYQRSGSSVLGEIFNSNPDALYVYEPVDAVYTALYGTLPGWNTPTDIFTKKDGSLRELPMYELRNVVETLSNLYTCNTDNLPTETFTHNYWTQFRRYQMGLYPGFLTCIFSARNTLEKCTDSLSGLCPSRFGLQFHKSYKCATELRSRDNNTASHSHIYHKCMERNRKILSPCMDIFKKTCTEKSIRAMKTVRMSMSAAAMLLSNFPRMRVLHLIRDPHAVAQSRLGTASFQGYYNLNRPVLEAKAYCVATSRDIRARLDIEHSFPGSTKQLVFEDWMAYPVSNVKEVYSFLNVSVPQTVLAQWSEDGQAFGKNATKVVNHWRDQMDQKTITAIDTVCKEFYELTGLPNSERNTS